MRKIISSTEKPRAIKKNVQFSQEIDSKEIYRTVINLLQTTPSFILGDKAKSTHLIDDAIKLVEEQFEKSSETYKKMMAKCYVKKALLLPFGEERTLAIRLAATFDPTDEKYFRH